MSLLPMGGSEPQGGGRDAVMHVTRLCASLDESNGVLTLHTAHYLRYDADMAAIQLAYDMTSPFCFIWDLAR